MRTISGKANSAAQNKQRGNPPPFTRSTTATQNQSAKTAATNMQGPTKSQSQSSSAPTSEQIAQIVIHNNNFREIKPALPIQNHQP